MIRRLVLPLLMALTSLTATPVAAQQREAYAIKTLADGTPYLGSDVFVAGRGPDLGQHVLDQALRISETGIRHVPTGLWLPRTEGGCTLQWITGLPVSGTGFETFERGGRAYYACTSIAPSFVVLSFEADMPRFAEILPDPGRIILASGMALNHDPDRLVCEEGAEAAVRRLSCRAPTSWHGQTVHEIGLFLGAGDTFLKLSAACLEAQCDDTITALDRLATVMGGDALTADARTD